MDVKEWIRDLPNIFIELGMEFKRSSVYGSLDEIGVRGGGYGEQRDLYSIGDNLNALGYVYVEDFIGRDRKKDNVRIPISRFSINGNSNIRVYRSSSLLEDRYEVRHFYSSNRHMSSVVLDVLNNVSYNTVGSMTKDNGSYEERLDDVSDKGGVYVRDRVFRDLNSGIYSVGEISHVMLDRVSTEHIDSGSSSLVGRYMLSYRYKGIVYSFSVGRHSEFQWSKSKVGDKPSIVGKLDSYIWETDLSKRLDGYMFKLGLR
jgi:hypothetical protein